MSYMGYSTYDDEEDSEIEYDDHPSAKELDLLSHKNDELVIVTIPDSVLHQTNGFNYYTIASVIHAGKFYVVNESAERASKQAALEKLMEDFYTTPNWKKHYRIKTTRVFVRRVYAWYNEKRNIWERIRVVNVDDMAHGKVTIERIDYGNECSVNISDMMEMNPRFCLETPLSSVAHLVHVQPSCGQIEWPQEATDLMLKLVDSKTRCLGAIFDTFKTSSTRRTSRGDFARIASLGLLLVPECSSGRLKISLQASLVLQGFAEGTGIGAGYPNLLFSDPTSQAEALENTTTITKHPEVESLQFKTINSERDMFLSVKSTNRVEQFLATESVQTSTSYQGFERLSQMAENLQISTFGTGSLARLPEDIKDALAQVSFSHINGPGNFYVQMMEDKEYLQNLMSDLTAKVATMECLTPSEIIPSQFVAALPKFCSQKKFSKIWHRAFVTETFNTIAKAKVILLDFGEECMVTYDGIRSLPEEFLEMRPVCRRAHLICPRMMPVGNKGWTSAANSAFKEYIKAWVIENPVYLSFIASTHQKPIKLNHFNEELAYSQATKSWTTNQKVSHGTAESSVNEFKNHGLLKYLLSSFGILIHYEDVSDIDECYKFKPVWDNLKDNGYLHPR